MYTAKYDRLEQLRKDALTKRALEYIANALLGMVGDAARLNDLKGGQYTELCLTAEEAALALAVIQNYLKPLPPGTMTA